MTADHPEVGAVVLLEFWAYWYHGVEPSEISTSV
jgi:hypothetical protein